MAEKPEWQKKFELVLAEAKTQLLADEKNFAEKDFWKNFETVVANKLKAVVEKNRLGWNVTHVGGHRYPDIIVEIEEIRVGVEVKTISTHTNDWKIMGGSIMESTRVDDVSEIYVFVGKLHHGKENKPMIEYKLFEKCVESVAVTHSPRYMLNMELDEEETIFNKINKSYTDIRNADNPFEFFRNYILQNTEDEERPWWYSENYFSSNQIERQEAEFAQEYIEKNIRTWRELKQSDRNSLKAEMLVLFPEILEGEFKAAHSWLLYNKFIFCPNFRDQFTAGGKRKIYNQDVPQVIYKVEYLSKQIQSFFVNNPERCSLEDWKSKALNFVNEEYKETFRKILSDIDISK